jgi:SAM-dependent methyltransferase
MSSFYDELAPFYHLIFDDWETSIERQGTMLTQIIRARWPDHHSLLDVSCGIGTQAIALAINGFQVKGSDISSRAVERAIGEARQRNMDIAFSVCDMREAFAQHGGGFDLVISCDNSIPHLLTDAEISMALSQMFACLRPGGGCVMTVRDYEREPRGKNIVKPIRAVTRSGIRYVVFQVWDFEGELYDLTMFFVEENVSTRTVSARAMRSRYYAIGIPRLIALMREAGFQDTKRLDDVFYQPVLLGTKPP